MYSLPQHSHRNPLEFEMGWMRRFARSSCSRGQVYGVDDDEDVGSGYSTDRTCPPTSASWGNSTRSYGPSTLFASSHDSRNQHHIRSMTDTTNHRSCSHASLDHQCRPRMSPLKAEGSIPWSSRSQNLADLR